MSTNTSPRVKGAGKIIYDDQFGHVCTCTESCTYDTDGYPLPSSYQPTVYPDRTIEPTEGGSWWYACSRCGAGTWSGC